MKKLTSLLLFSTAIAVTALSHVQSVWATKSDGFVGTTLAKGTLGSFNALNLAILPASAASHQRVWLATQETRESSDLYVQSNVWQPGGSTGWHSHPAYSLITVTQGEISDYESNDPGCKPHVYQQGMSFVDYGGGHVHIIRNEGSAVAKTIAVQLVPAGAMRRIDAAPPANCPGIQ